MSICRSPARGEARRRNGAKSRGPRTPEGKARSAQNALKHGLCAQKHLVLCDEDAQAFAALEASIIAELAPEGILQRILAARVVRAAWRLERAERIETELFALRSGSEGNFALALIRDGNGSRAFDTLLRYRGGALAELFRSLRLLQALQDQARAIVVPPARPSPPRQPNEPKARTNPGESVRSWSIEPDAGHTARVPGQTWDPGAAAAPGRRAPPGSSDQGRKAASSRSS
jgi:hypothetical protein